MERDQRAIVPSSIFWRWRTHRMRTIDLIYDTDCPNVGKTRANLLAACAALGIMPRWFGLDRPHPATPVEMRRYGSPTLLIDGTDIAGKDFTSDTTAQVGATCRLYSSPDDGIGGVPPVELIVAALKASNPIVVPTPLARKGWRSTMVTLPGIAAVMLPVGTCPACFAAYAGVLGGLGIGPLLQAEYLLPIN